MPHDPIEEKWTLVHVIVWQQNIIWTNFLDGIWGTSQWKEISYMYLFWSHILCWIIFISHKNDTEYIACSLKIR